ncbi:MAG: C39 family peptidase [Pseudomonadota bacterium]
MSQDTRSQVLRFADAQTGDRHPLGPLAPLPPVLTNGNRALLCFDLPPLAPGMMVLPSCASLATEPYRFRFSLADVPLAPVPSAAEELPAGNPAAAGSGAPVEQHLDYFHIREALPAAQLLLEVEPAAALSSCCLITLSLRPQLTPAPNAPEPLVTPAPPTLSQRLADPAIAMRICSPTATTMALLQQGYTVDWKTFTAACRDPATGMYGVWPLNVYQASRHQALGAVESFSDWTPVTRLLAAGIPVVASIRYANGALPGAPQAQSGGHLVLVYGVDADNVLVNDPAGERPDAVRRRYPRRAFERAWFAERGAGYYFLPAPRD